MEKRNKTKARLKPPRANIRFYSSSSCILGTQWQDVGSKGMGNPVHLALHVMAHMASLSWLSSLPAAFHSRQSTFLTSLNFCSFQYIFSFTLPALHATPEELLARILTWIHIAWLLRPSFYIWVELSMIP